MPIFEVLESIVSRTTPKGSHRLGASKASPFTSSSVMVSHLLWEQGFAGSSPVSVTLVSGISTDRIADYESADEGSIPSQITLLCDCVAEA